MYINVPKVRLNRLLQICCIWEKVNEKYIWYRNVLLCSLLLKVKHQRCFQFNSFHDTTNLQQTTLKETRQKHRKQFINKRIRINFSSKHDCKKGNCSVWAIYSFTIMFSEVVCYSGITYICRLERVWLTQVFKVPAL